MKKYMQKYYVSTKATIILGFMFIMPYILTKLSFMTIKGWGQMILKDSLFWVSDSKFDSEPIYYLYSLLFLLASLFVIGATVARYDERIDRFIKKIPFISWLYGIFNQLFSVKKTPKGVPIVLNIYGSEYCNVTCFIPSFQKRWAYVTQKGIYCWCYTLIPPPDGNPIGGHNQHAPCEIIDKEMIKQYAGLTFDELITYCVSFGMSFPDRLTQQGIEETPEWVVAKLKLENEKKQETV